MWPLYLFLLTVGECLPDNPENDGEASRKVLGSSVVTSISVIMDNGNGSKIYTDAVGNPVSKPLTSSDLASPIELLNPDRYEFYTFDDNGELVKRLMTLDEIQDIIATGDSDVSLDSLTSGLLPEKRVNEVVNNVQSVLKTEMANHKEPNPTIFDTPDVSDSWSMILPAVFGNSGEDIKPERPAAHVTPDTIMIEPDISASNKPYTSTSATLTSITNTLKPITDKLTTLSTVSPKTSPSSTATTRTSTIITTTPSTKIETTVETLLSTSKTTFTNPEPIKSTTIQIEYIEIKPVPNIETTPKQEQAVSETTIVPNATLISISSTTVNGSLTITQPPSRNTTSKIPSSTIDLLSLSRTEPLTSSSKFSNTTVTLSETDEVITNSSNCTEKSNTILTTTKTPVNLVQNDQFNQKDTQISELVVVSNNNISKTTTVQEEKVTVTTEIVTEKEQTATTENLRTETKLPTTDILEKLLLSSTKISQINSELSEKPGTNNYSTKFESTTDVLITNSLDEKTDTTELFTTTDQTLTSSIEKLFAQDINNMENPISNLDNEKIMKTSIIINSENKTIMEDVQKETAETVTTTLSLLNAETTTQKNILNDIESDSTVLDSVGSLLSQVIESGQNLITTDIPLTTILYSTVDLNAEKTTKDKNTKKSELITTESSSLISTQDQFKQYLTKISNIESTEIPELDLTDVIITEEPNSSKTTLTDQLILGTTEILKQSSVETWKLNFTKESNVNSTETSVENISEVLEQSSSSTEVSIEATKLNITETSNLLSTTEATKENYHTTFNINDTTKTEAFTPHLINITIINRNYTKPAKADLSLEIANENELKKNISLLEHKTEASFINFNSTSEINREVKIEIAEHLSTTKIEVTTFKPKIPYKPLIVININENDSVLMDKPEQDKTESLWTPVSTLSPAHVDVQKTSEPSSHIIPLRIEDIVEPPKPINLVPKPLQGFALEESTSNLDPDIYNFVQLCNELSFDFWKIVTNGISTARSLVISPFSATSLLAMIFLGARGATSGEMNEILKLDDMVTFNPHLIFKNISEYIRVSHESGVATATLVRELFSDRSKGKLLSFYKERVKQFYDGHVEEVSFKEINDIIRRRTNLLVKKHTGGKIQEYLKDSSISMRAPLAALSVSIFHTDCSHASSIGHDGEIHFVVLPSIRQRRLIPIPAAVWRSNFLAGYEPSLDATAVALGTKDHVVSTIFVIPGQQGIPAPGDGLARLEKRLVESAFKKGAWSRLLRSLIPRPGLELQIPRFSHKSVINATLSLQQMGLKDLFDARKADLSGLNGVAHELYLSDMLQLNNFATCGESRIGEAHHTEIYPATPERSFRKSRNLDNYEGSNFYLIGDEPRDYQRAFHDPLHDPNYLSLPLSERPRQARLPEVPRLKFDRPFLFFVRHNPTGAILHMGRFHPRLIP